MYVIAQFPSRKTLIMATPGARQSGPHIPESTMNAYKKVFLSYWQAGYEGADHISHTGQPVCMNDATRHTEKAYEDYLLLKEFGIRTVRESVGWRSVEKNGRFDFSSVAPRAQAARKLGLQVIWTLCHYGWPDDVNVYSPEFVERFYRYCRRTVHFLEAFSQN